MLQCESRPFTVLGVDLARHLHALHADIVGVLAVAELQRQRHVQPLAVLEEDDVLEPLGQDLLDAAQFRRRRIGQQVETQVGLGRVVEGQKDDAVVDVRLGTTSTRSASTWRRFESRNLQQRCRRRRQANR